MKKIKCKFVAVFFIILFLLTGNGWASIEMPHAYFDGYMMTFLDSPADEDIAFFNAKIVSVFYSNGSSSLTDVIIGKNVWITGSQRDCLLEPCTTFTDAELTITDGSVLYFRATLTNFTFITDGVQWYLNPGLDVNDPETLNLKDIELYPNGSEYILDLQNVLGSQSIAGMKMRVNSFIGDMTGDGVTEILEGLIDGVQANNLAAEAGDNINVSSEGVSSTVIAGTVTGNEGDILSCRWMDGETALTDWMPADNGACVLDLYGTVLNIGPHTFTLEVSNGSAEASDAMLLTLENSAPHAALGGNITAEINTIVLLTGDVSDYDGDILNYEWSGSGAICVGSIQSIAEGLPVMLDDCELPVLGLGVHTFTLAVTDELGLSETKNIQVEIVDTTQPTLAPVASQYLLWPPNHNMIDIAVDANAVDNSDVVTLNVTDITSNEPVDGLDDGDIGPDWTDLSLIDIDQTNGIIYFQLRRERSGTGEGREYSVTITATDISGNTSTSVIPFIVPHDMKKKK